MKMYDEKAREVRNSAANKVTSHNMRHCGKEVIMKVGKIALFPVK